MNVEVEETGPVARRLRVEVPTAEVDAAFDEVYRDLGRSVRLKGFRAGRAPRSVLARYLGERARAEVLERLIRASLPRALDERELAPLGDPGVRPAGEPKEGAPFVYEAEIEIRPEIELRRVRGLQVPRPRLPAPEGDPVEAYLEELRASHAQLVEEAEGAVAARGHVAVIDYEGTIDGAPFEGSSGRERPVEIGAGATIPGFDDELVGLPVGGEREFELQIPDSWRDERVAGRGARFRVRLLELKRRELPALDDEFAKDVSERETLEELRADLARRVEEGRRREEERALREAAAGALLEANPFPAPPGLVERQLESRIGRALSALGGRLPPEEFERAVARWREEWRGAAERDVRLALLVPEVAKAEGIEVSDEDLDARLRELAEQAGRPLGELKRSLRERGALEGIRAGLLEERVVDLIVSAATLSDT